MEKNRITGIIFIALAVLSISLGSFKLLNNRIFNGEIEISKDEIKEVNDYLKDKYNIKSSKTVIFEEYYQKSDGNIVSELPKEDKYITNRIYLVKNKDDEFYVKKEIGDEEKLLDNYVNISLNKNLAKYLSKKYSNFNIKNIDIKEYDKSKFLLQNNSSLYPKELLNISDKEYLEHLQNSELEINIETKDELNRKNIKDEVKELIDTINKEKEIKINTLRVNYKNHIYIEYYKNIISIYSDDKDIYDKYIVLDKNVVNEDSIYVEDFMKLDNNVFTF